MGEKRAIAALMNSMANGWQGIFEPDAKTAKRNEEASQAQTQPQMTEAERRAIRERMETQV